MSTGSVFVLAISAWYLAARPARRIRQALDDGRGELRSRLGACRSSCWATRAATPPAQNQKMKIAAIEAMWNTEPAPASFTVFGLPDLATHTTRYEIKVPWVLGLIATRSVDTAGARHQRAGWPRRKSASRTALSPMTRCRSCEPTGTTAAVARDVRRACRRSRLCAAAQALYRPDDRERDAGGNRRRPPAARCPMCRVLFWSLPLHGGARLLVHRAVCAQPSGSAARRQLDRYRWFLRPRCLRLCRCPGSLPNSAGSSPNMAASPG